MVKAPFLSKLAQVITPPTENLNSVIARIGHYNMAFFVKNNPSRIVKFSVSITF